MARTRRTAATASAEPLRTSASTSPPPPPRRRLRSEQNASPLQSLEEIKPTRRSAPQPGAGKAAVSKAKTTKRKRDAPQKAVTAANEADVESGPEAEEGIFFTEIATVRQENLDLRQLVRELEARETVLNDENAALRREIYDLKREAMLRTGQGQANPDPTDIDMFGMTSTDDLEAGLVGSDEAMALLRHVVDAKNAPRTAQPVVSTEPASPPRAQQPAQGESPRGAAEITPSRPLSNPGSFFSRSFSAIKSKLGFSTPTPTPPPASTSPPPPNTMTEVLSAPPTPIGERSKAPLKKRKQSPTLRLLLKGIDASDLPKAEKWAKQIVADMKNRGDFEVQRNRLQTPVLVENLKHLPSSKPWESGFGDPLGDLDDEAEAPVWAVYLDLLAEEEEPKRKKTKSSHEVSTGLDDTLSLDELAAAGKVHDSHGTTASHLDLHPRPSKEPSPMFTPSASHQQGNNVFNEFKGQEATAELQSTIKLPGQKTSDTPSKHNPSQGSYGLDYSDDEDTSMFSENSDLDGSTSPIWTQAPPPAPVPAHAPLPGTETSSTATSQQPVDEIQRQRQKLMKHTPAKPSRLREAFLPSPSMLSDAGNASALGSSLAAPGLFDDMPDAEDLGLTAEDWAAVEALRNTEEFKAADAAVVWPDAQMTYDSDEETLSPE